MKWPEKVTNGKTLNDILEKKVDPKYYASPQIVQKRKKMHTSQYHPAIWHETKLGISLRIHIAVHYELVQATITYSWMEKGDLPRVKC